MYIFIIVLILFLRIILANYRNSVNYGRIELIFVRIVAFVLIFISAFRGVTVGTDTPSYMYDYYSMGSFTYQDILSVYEGYIGYYLPSKFCYDLGVPLQVWFALVSMIYVIPVTIVINRYSKDKLYSMLCFFLMGAFMFSLAGLKQTVAMGAMMLAFIAFTDKRYVIALLLAYWGCLSHNIALIFFAVVPMYMLKGNMKFYSYCVLGIVGIVLSYSYIFETFITILDSEHYESYLNEGVSYSPVLFVYYCSLLLLAIFSTNYKHKGSDADINKFMFGMSSLCTAFQTFAFVSASAFRISLFFLPFYSILLPNTMTAKNKRPLKIIVAIIVIVFYLYTSRNVPGYKFIWDAPYISGVSY